VHLPENWKLQTQLKWQQDVGIAMLREVINLVESKILHCRMYYIESKPIDSSLPPLHPVRPYFLLFALGGGCLGFCLVYGWLFLRQCYRGFPASLQALQKEGQRLLGAVSPRCYALSQTYPTLQEWDKNDRETLQNIFFFLKDRTGVHRTRMSTVLLLGSSLSLSLRLSELASMYGQRILWVDCRSSSDVGFQKGLRDYLSGEIQDLPLVSEQGRDTVFGGGICRYGYDHSEGLDPLRRLDRYLARYDVLVLLDDFPSTSLQAHGMLGAVDKVICVVQEERLEDLTPYFNEKKTTFVTVEA
jgi:tyrosine-protein kinase Etk/Wzc